MAIFGSQVQNRFLSLSQLLGLPSNETLEIFSRVRQPGGGLEVGEVDVFWGWRSFLEKANLWNLFKGIPPKNVICPTRIQAIHSFLGMDFLRGICSNHDEPGLFTSAGCFLDWLWIPTSSSKNHLKFEELIPQNDAMLEAGDIFYKVHYLGFPFVKFLACICLPWQYMFLFRYLPSAYIT